MVIHALIRVRNVERRNNEMVLRIEDLAENITSESFNVDVLDPEFYRTFTSGTLDAALNAKGEYLALFHEDRRVYPR